MHNRGRNKKMLNGMHAGYLCGIAQQISYLYCKYNKKLLHNFKNKTLNAFFSVRQNMQLCGFCTKGFNCSVNYNANGNKLHQVRIVRPCSESQITEIFHRMELKKRHVQFLEIFKIGQYFYYLVHDFKQIMSYAIL